MTSKKTPAQTPATIRVVAFLKKVGVASVDEIAAGAFVGKKTLTCAGYLRQLRQDTIYIKAWRFRPDRVGNGAWEALYGLRDQVGLEDERRPAMDRSKMNPPAMRSIEFLLQRIGAMTLRRIAGLAKVSICTARRHVDVLHKEQKRIHIASWNRGRWGIPVPVYSAGEGVDAKVLAPLSSSELKRRHRLKMLSERSALLMALNEQLFRKAA